MSMTCEKCGKTVTAAAGEYVYYQNRMMFACRNCADRLNDEVKCDQRICTAIDSKKEEAEHITNNRDAFDKFIKNVGASLKKIPSVGNLLSDIPLLVSLVTSYVQGEYKEIPYNSIVAVISTLLYVLSPLDLIPDVIPGVGYADDAMAVAFCVKMLHRDLEKYTAWRNQNE